MQNPGALIVHDVNATSPPPGMPADDLLKDVSGKPIGIWPGNPPLYLANLTKPGVPEFIANYAYQLLVQSGLAYDGIFFDDFFTSISWETHDVYGNPVQIDANGDGVRDDPATLDAAWKAGVYRMIAAFRKLAPYAYVSGHLNHLPPQPEDLAAFNGDSLVFDVANVREGKLAFATLLDTYGQWFSQGRRPVITMVQSSPPNQLAYGYGYTPSQTMLPPTAEFARAFYANMRFGLGVALLGDGFFAHDFGDVSSPATWWYDEYDFDLGSPRAAATKVAPGVYRRDFTKGVVLVNGNATAQTIAVEPGLRRFQGVQAPLFQYIVDDRVDVFGAPGSFSATGAWTTPTFDTGGLKPAGPYYHAIANVTHVSGSPSDTAQWTLGIPASGQYAISVWLPAAPGASAWTKSAIYEIVSAGVVVASATIDQSQAAAGDRWYTIGTANLIPAGSPVLRVRNGGSGALVADAAYVRSDALYNDGAPVTRVTLGAFDAILLQREANAVPGIAIDQHGLTGSWYEPITNGQGVEVEIYPDLSGPGNGLAQLSWFTFDRVAGAADRQRWYTLSGPVTAGGSTARLAIYQNTGGNFDAPPITHAQRVGDAVLSFDSCTSGKLAYDFTDGSARTATLPLARITQNVSCVTAGTGPVNGDFALSGNWYTPATSGQGITAEINPLSGMAFVAWYTYAPNGAGSGVSGLRWYTAQGAFSAGMRSIPLQIFETTGGMFDEPTVPPPTTTPVGSATLAFQSCTSATLAFAFTGGPSNGASGTLALERVGPVPPGCTM